MCNEVITKYPQCGHEDSDTFPCDALLDTGTCPGPTAAPKILNREDTPCNACAETQHLEAALLRIEQDSSLAPVSRSGGKDPNAPKHYLQTREFFPKCGHGARYQWTDFEADPEHLYIDTEIPLLVCYGCEWARPGAVEALKARGMWEGNDDPWGEKAKVAGGAGASGIAAGTDAGAGAGAGAGAPVSVPAPVYAPTPSGAAAATSRPARPVPVPGRADDEDLYASSPKRSFWIDEESGPEEEGEGEGEYDTSAAKNKGIRGRLAPGVAPDPEPEPALPDLERYPSGRHAEQAQYSDDDSDSYYDDDDDDDDDDDRHRRHDNRHGHDHDLTPAPLRSRPHASSPPPPHFTSRSPSPSPPPSSPLPAPTSPNAPAVVSPEERARLGMGGLQMSQAQFLRWRARKESEGQEAMVQFKSGGLEGV